MNELIEMDLPVTYEFVTRDNIPKSVKSDKLSEDAGETLRLFALEIMTSIPVTVSMLNQQRDWFF